MHNNPVQFAVKWYKLADLGQPFPEDFVIILRTAKFYQTD
jgi:hypothetical protein